MQQPFYGHRNPSHVHHNAHIISVLGVSDQGNQRHEQLGSMRSSLSSLVSMSNIVWSSMRLPPMYHMTPYNIDRSSDLTAKNVALWARQACLRAVKCYPAASTAWIRGEESEKGTEYRMGNPS